MAREKSIMQRLAVSADLEEEPLPGLPLVEIAGDQRVLVENHFGVMEYSDTAVGIRVKFGEILVCGSKLRLTRMTRGQLIISGCIECVRIIKG